MITFTDVSPLLATTNVRITIALVLGLLIGSFLNVVISRLPLRMLDAWRRDSLQFLGVEEEPHAPPPGVCFPGSHCPACKTPIKPWHNIPLLGFILLKGRCASCGVGIAWRYPVVEGLCGGLFVLLAAGETVPFLLLGGFFLSAMLIVLAFIDAETGYLPDSLTQPLLWAGLLFNLLSGHVALSDAVMGAMAGYLLLWLVYWGFRMLTGKEGMGPGDFKLLAALGAWLGWSMLPIVILFSSLAGAVAGVILIALRRHQFGKTLPFGPYLAAAGWCAWYRGEAILQWYLYGY
ncbi:prepilin peptidase [Paludibacterium paludis]|uniref:Prepilin leader peptidase/N-methyltransferase n=1 Tax=Paludibacterium paludis TaxID=1225769 RepID=A0A918NZ22_9NEIS|nr:A24 family peptidase [Paludibacterium paludis]GGY08205.1 type 4 prepilin-like proteins leader peptide-processing enzyme [Paludibacterium paludis]